MYTIYARTIDGEEHFVLSYSTYEEALAYLRQAAQECRACHHRRVELDENEGVLVTSYGGDDTVVTFIEEEAEEIA